MDDGNSHNTRPDSITVTLYADGSPVNATPSWTKSGNTWTYTFGSVPSQTPDGVAISYTVRETPVENYQTSISGTTITNTLIEKPTENFVEISGQKTWDDNDNAAGLRPTSITVRLLRDGEEVESRNVTAGTNWSYSFGNQPEDDGYGNIYVYTVREDGVSGYFTSVNGYDITNRLLPTAVPQSDTPTDGTPRGGRNATSNVSRRANDAFASMTIEELEELIDLFGYQTPLFGMMATGDETPVYPWVFGGMGLAALLALLAIGRKRRIFGQR